MSIINFMLKSNQKLNIKLLLILLVAFILRLYGMNWDGGFHLHPDERMIIIVADQIHFFDKLNPHFFNYGSFPIYLLKGIAQGIDLLFSSTVATYQGLLNLGRILSIIFDLGTTFIIYKIALFFFKKKEVGYFSSFIYAITFFAIQNSHFFTVDILFTLLSILLLYRLLLFAKNHSFRSVLIIGIVFAALFATKFTAVIFFPIIVILILIIKNKFSLFSILHSLFFILISLFFSILFMPYAFLDFSQFTHDVSLQLMMNRNPYIFSYTLQYVNTLSYWYYLKNIFLWGMGPFVSILSVIGVIQVFLDVIARIPTLRRGTKQSRKIKGIASLHFVSLAMTKMPIFLFFLFYFLYFLVIGRSAVKFMRYMLPLYPFLTIFAGLGFYSIEQQWYKIYPRSRMFLILFRTCILLLLSIWSIMFISIYSQPNARVNATEWILKNIPAGSSLAVEYWDDYLPIYGGERYHFNELHLYDIPDDDKKWIRLNKQLEESDYIIIASNRLYTPLQKLADCFQYKVCYPKTAEYYKKLFNSLPVIPSPTAIGRGISFKKVAEFSVRPGIKIGSFKFEINDESADESFTVFDHPKVMIFKKNKR